MATYGGIDIFGRAYSIVPGDIQLDRQENGFPGLNGVESLTLGQRGLMIQVTGTLFDTGANDLGVIEQAFRSYKDGIARDLVDTLATTFPNVVLESFSPQGMHRQTPAGIRFRKYTAVFKQL